jgi:hypothetical protein
MRELTGTYAEQEEQSYAGCKAFLDDEEGSINTVNQTLERLIEEEFYAQAEGIKRAMLDYMQGKVVVCYEQATLENLEEDNNNLNN